MSRIKNWFAVYTVAGLIDVLQWLSDATGIGLGLNAVIDPFIGVGFAGFFQMKGVSMIARPSRLASLIGATVIEETTLSIPPAWIIDVWYIHKSVKDEEASNEAATQSQSFDAAGKPVPYYSGGVGRVRTNTANPVRYTQNGRGRARGNIQAGDSRPIGREVENEEVSLAE